MWGAQLIVHPVSYLDENASQAPFGAQDASVTP